MSHGHDDPPPRPLSAETATSGLAPLGHLTTELRGTPEPPPERIGKYRVLHELGHGGMGSVLLAIRDDDQFKKRVAIKLIKRGMDTREVLKRFELERQVLSALNHPNIARLLDGGQTDDGRPYFVLEHVEGLPIDEYCDVNNLPIIERIKLFRKVCASVQYAHQNLIVHRDIKPSNILVGENGEPKLLDFGIAKMLNPELFNVTLATGPEVRLMTPEYASPEQVQGQPISTASDVYGLGVLLYELMTGRRPYQIRSRLQQEIVRIICEVEPEKPSTAITQAHDVITRDGVRTVTPEEVAKKRAGDLDKLRKGLRGDIDNILLKALQKAPRRRYSSAEQFAEDLQRYLDGMPVLAQPDKWGYRSGKFIRRHRFGVTSAAAILILLVAGIAGTTWQWRRAAEAEQIASRRAESFGTVIDKFVESLQGQLQRAEGSTAARKMVAETALAAAEQLKKESGDDVVAQRKLAQVQVLLGDVQGGIRGASEGNSSAALESYEKSLDALEARSKENPDDDRIRRELAVAHLKVGDSLAKLDRIADARSHYGMAVDIARSLCGKHPADTRLSRFLAQALASQGDMLLALGEKEAAGGEYRESLKIRERLHIESPSEESTRDLTVGINKLGKYFESIDRIQEALKEYQRSVEIRRGLLATSPDARTKRDVAIAQEKVAGALAGLNRKSEAAATLKEALEAIDDLIRKDPSDGRVNQDAARMRALLSALEQSVSPETTDSAKPGEKGS